MECIGMNMYMKYYQKARVRNKGETMTQAKKSRVAAGQGAKMESEEGNNKNINDNL